MTIEEVFVPMYGDSFFTIYYDFMEEWASPESFRPHVWGFFFHRNAEIRVR